VKSDANPDEILAESVDVMKEIEELLNDD